MTIATEKINTSNIDDILRVLNIRSAAHEASTLRENSKDNSIQIETVTDILNQEGQRLKSPELLRSLEGFILATIYGYSVTPTEEGDILNLEEKHVEKGRLLLEKNKTMWGEFVFPLLLYGTEYIVGAYELLPKKRLDIGDLVGSTEMSEDDYFMIVDKLVRMAIQTRYRHLMKCHVEDVLGNPEYRSADFSTEMISDGKIINVD